MHSATVVHLPSPARTEPRVRVSGERIVVEQLVVADPALAAFVGQRSEDGQVELVERALRIGLLAVQDAGTSVDVDFVRREFETMLQRTETAQQRAADTLDGVLRANFADGDGRLPRTLERFLGNRGELNRFVSELFDESKRDSAIGRLRTLLGTYFEGDGSRLAQLLDPTRLGSPLHQFRLEVTEGFGKLNERLSAIEAASAARAVERARSAAKGADFEDLLEAMLGDLLRGSADLLERTGADAGDVIRSRKGDFVLSLDPQRCRGADLRVVIEAKDRPVSARGMRDELSAAKQNRGAVVALVCFSAEHAPAGVAPFDIRGTDVYCVVDPQAPDKATLGGALQLCRLLAAATVRDQGSEVDVEALSRAIEGVRGQLDAIRGLKAQLTSIGTASRQVNAGLDRMREGVLARLAEAQALLLLPPSG
ncbi:hypothetical protein BH24CHL6_BH24CHL6_12890 [soil metagenome]